jgi:hypothetical protein
LRTKAGVQAQKFTVDPKLLAQANVLTQNQSQGQTQVQAQAQAKPQEKKKDTRQEMLDRLAREYEEEQAKGCTMCSA